ncbi:MAG: hypothetical protein HQL51_05865 [Magnetococcales bacterium]|nr:hypothetical protein [Magnetococcales bacterium]
MLAGNAPALMEKAVQLALAGDPAALRLCLERLIPPVKATDEAVQLPDLAGLSLADQGRVILAAVGRGEISPLQGNALLQGLGTLVRVVEATELEERIAALEAKKDE